MSICEGVMEVETNGDSSLPLSTPKRRLIEAQAQDAQILQEVQLLFSVWIVSLLCCIYSLDQNLDVEKRHVTHHVSEQLVTDLLAKKVQEIAARRRK